MMKKLHFKFLLLLCALMAGSGSAWANGTLISGLNDIASGKTYYIAALNSGIYYTVPNTTIDAQTFTCTAGTYSETKLTTPDGAGEFVFTAVDGVNNAYYIYNTNLGKYLVATGSKKFGYVDSNSSDYGYWTFSTVSSGGFSGAFSVNHSSKTQYMRAYSNSVRCYDGTSNNGVYLFEKVTLCATPTFSETSGSELTKGTEVTITSATDGSTIYYTTNGDTPTTSSTSGTAGAASATVTVNTDMTVKAIAVKAGNADSEVATATYTTVKSANSITVTGGTTQNIALTGVSAIENGMYDLSAIVSATHGTVAYSIKSTENLVEGTDFEFADGLFEFSTTYKGVIVVTASVAADADYYATEQDITINVNGDLRTPFYVFDDTEQMNKGQNLTVANGDNIVTPGTITLTTTNEEVASVDNDTHTITAVGVGSCTITVATAATTYYAEGSKSFTLNVIDPKGSATNPYTVAEARAAIDAAAGSTIENVCVRGIVCTGGSDLSSGKMTYWISDDGTQTNKFQVYKGYGLDNANFTNQSDIQVDDIVTVKGDIILYNSSIYQFNTGSQLTSFRRKYDSDLTVTTPVNLEMTTAAPHPTATVTKTTSSTGAMSYASNNNAVATVTADGVITAEGAGTATITVSQAADEDYKASGNKTVTVNVTDNRTLVATDIDLPVAQKTLTKGDIDDFAATSTPADGFSGTITYSYATSNSAIVTLAGETYEAVSVGTATITITATPTGGNADNYKAASNEVPVIVNGTNSISLSSTAKEVAYGSAPFTITATVPTDNYNGRVTATSDNTAVATVSVSGKTVTVTPLVAGTATITVTSGTDTYYPATASAICAVTVSAPEGLETAAPTVVTVFSETFDGITQNASNATTQGGNSNGQANNNDIWNGNAGATAWSTVSSYCDETWTDPTSVGGGYQCIKLGAGSSQGSIVTSALGVAGDMTLTFKAGAWDSSTEKTTDGLVLSIEAGGGILGTTTFDLKIAEWDTYETTITGATADTKVKFSAAQSSKNRFFLDDVLITKTFPAITATLNGSGYATFCSEYPLDFSESLANGYSAWQITDIDKTNNIITFARITDAIKGGQGVLLKGDADDEITIPSVNSTNTLTGNKLRGTLAPTYFADETMYGLSGDKFYLNSPCTLSANRAYLPANEVNTSRSLVMKFLDDTQGVSTIERVEMGSEAVYDLSGRRVAQPTKGMYIVNGKKVFVK